jgi:hypothetical protein
MNTIVCLSVCIIVIAAFFTVPWLMARRYMKDVTPALTKKENIGFEIALVAVFLLMISLVAPMVADLSEGYAALYVDSVGWWTL